MSFWSRLFRKQEAYDAAWVSPHGAGTSLDRSMRGQFAQETLSYTELVRLYDHNGIVKSAVGRVYEDALRGGYVLTSADEDPETLAKIRRDLSVWDEENGLTVQAQRHLIQADLFGGSGLLHIVDSDQTVPYSLTRGKGDIRFLAMTPLELYGSDVEHDPLKPGYGLPRWWTVGQSPAGYKIDESWVRAKTSDQITSATFQSGRLDSWVGPSVLSSFYQDVRSWGISMQAVVSALQELSRTVYKLKGMAIMAGAGEAALEKARRRIRDLEEAVSIFQPAVLDTEEAMERSPMSLGGASDILGHVMISLCAAARVPVTVLFGVSPGGFGTGEGELRIYHDRVRAKQRTDVRPTLRWLLARLFESGQVQAPKGEWGIEFPPLVTPTEDERAELRKMVSETDVAYINAGVLSPNEVAQGRYGGTEWSMETTLDLEERERDELETPESDEELAAQERRVMEDPDGDADETADDDRDA